MHGKVVVITGASSGLGRQSAVAFAQRGARLVLAARREAALQETAQLCDACGAEALVVATDVTQEDQVESLVKAALAVYGNIDVWINNAGVMLFASLEQAPFSSHRRVLETNLCGAMLGARAVLPVFRRQRTGVLINVGSILSKVGQPFVPAYVISKFGLHGLSEALRAELADEPGIHVCTIYPYACDTQHCEVGANELGQCPLAMPPMQSPEYVAQAIVHLAEHPVRERHVPRMALLGLAVHSMLPGTVERLFLHALRRWHAHDRPAPCTAGNLFDPDAGTATVHGARRPRVHFMPLASWTLSELARIELAGAKRRLKALGQRISSAADVA